MKRLFVLLLMMSTGFLAGAQTNFRFISYAEALEAAKVENKLVFIDFYTEWCGPCKAMARDVFPQKKLGDFMNTHFVCIKLDAEKEGKEAAEQYNIESYPTFVVIDAKGKELYRKIGGTSAENLTSLLLGAIDPEKTPERLKERYESGERTPEVVRVYAGIQMEKIQYMPNNQEEKEKVFQMVRDYFENLTDEERLAPENMFMYLEYVDKPSDEIGQYMIAHHQDFPASVQEEINRRIKELMENHVGFVLCGLLPYDAEDCRVTKESAINLGWDKNGQYTVAFKFIDARVAGDVSAYLDLLERDFHKLMVLHQELLLFQLGNIIQPETDAEKERLIKILRNWLPEMSPRQISFVAPALMDLEGKGH